MRLEWNGSLVVGSARTVIDWGPDYPLPVWTPADTDADVDLDREARKKWFEPFLAQCWDDQACRYLTRYSLLTEGVERDLTLVEIVSRDWENGLVKFTVKPFHFHDARRRATGIAFDHIGWYVWDWE
jgi:hypothetical protein